MPFVAPRRTGMVAGLPEQPRDDYAPGAWEVIQSAFRVSENTLVTVPKLIRDDPVRGVTDQDFDPVAEVTGTPYEDMLEAFYEADSPEEVALVKARIDQEFQDLRNVRAGGALGVVASMAAGTLDPVNFIPVVGAAVRLRAGSSLLKAGALTALEGFAAASTQEVLALQAQATRTRSEAAFNITAATFLSGLLGGGVARLSGARRARLLREIEEDLGDGPVGGGSGLDEAGRLTLSDEEAASPALMESKVKGALGAERLSAMLRLSPALFVAVRSKSNAARRMVEKMVETPFLYSKNFLGEATEEAAESRTLLWQRGRLGQLIGEGDAAYRNYRRRVVDKPAVESGELSNRLANFATKVDDRVRRISGRPAQYLSENDFHRAVGRAMRYGDESGIPEVQAMAKQYRELFDELKDAAIAQKLLPADVGVDTATSYLTRVYVRRRLRVDPGNRFRNITTKWLRKEHAELSEKQAAQVADEIRDWILHTPDGRVLYESMEFKAGPLKFRTFTIPDEAIEEFLEDDIRVVARHYVGTMAPDIELTRAFRGAAAGDDVVGPVRYQDAAREVFEEYKQLIAEAPPAQREALERELQEVNEKLQGMWDLLRGTFRTSGSARPDSMGIRAMRVSRAANYLRLGGDFAINSVPDVGRVVAVDGYIRAFGTPTRALIRDYKSFKLLARENRLAGAVMELQLDTRAGTIADIGEEFAPNTKFERGLKAMTSNFSLINGLSIWNAGMKHWAGFTLQHRMIDTIEKIATGGKVSKGALRDLAQLGIDERLAHKMFRMLDGQADGFRSPQGVLVADTTQWTDAELVRRYRTALRKGTDQVIVSSGVGDKPLFMSREWGRTIGQFKTFQFAATNRALIPALQRRDANSLNSVALSMFLGMGVYYYKMKASGREPSDDLGTWVREGVDRSGVPGIVSDINGTVEGVTRGYGLNKVFGGPMLTRYQARNRLGNLGGPGVSLLEDFQDVLGATTSGDFRENDLRKARRMLPYQGVFWLRGLYDAAEAGIREQAGVRPR